MVFERYEKRVEVLACQVPVDTYWAWGKSVAGSWIVIPESGHITCMSDEDFKAVYRKF